MIAKTEKPIVAINVRSDDPDFRVFRNQFKSWCAKKDCTMQRAIIALMQFAMQTDLNIDAINEPEFTQ